MKILTNEDLNKKLTNDETLWIYNGLDCCITSEIYGKMCNELDPKRKHTYNFEKAMLGPALYMMRGGIRFNEKEQAALTQPPIHAVKILTEYLNDIAHAVWDKPLNHNSPIQLQKLLYKTLDIPPITIYDRSKKRVKITTDRDALKLLATKYPRAKLFAETIIMLRDAEKIINVLATKRDDDGRMRCSYNIAGTETGRWSSSESPLRTGTNLQNITGALRSVFIPDKNQKLFYADLDQAESRVVAYLSEDKNYIDACESGDLHTTVVKMVWPEKDWTGDPQEDRKLADESYYMHFSYRDMCKRAGHGTNYGLQAKSLQNHLRIELKYATRFQLMYYGGQIPYVSLERWHKQTPEGGFDILIDNNKVIGKAPKGIEKDKRIVEIAGAFPGIRKWHDTTAHILQTEGKLITPLGRCRQFWQRLNDNSTLRAAIAFIPQSTVGDLLNIGLYRVWKELGPDVSILAQVHDAILGQCAINLFDEKMKNVVQCMTNPLLIHNRKMIIPVSIEVGMTWGKKAMENYNV